MHQIIFVAEPEQIDDLELDENPADHYPVMSSQEFHRDARAQLYALVTGTFFDEASELEILRRSLTDDGPYIYQLEASTQRSFSRLDEDTLGEFAERWAETEEIELLDRDVNDLYDFLYQFAHLCHVATQGEDLGLFIYSDS